MILTINPDGVHRGVQMRTEREPESFLRDVEVSINAVMESLRNDILILYNHTKHIPCPDLITPLADTCNSSI